MWYLTITHCLDVMSGQQEVYLLHMQELRNLLEPEKRRCHCSRCHVCFSSAHNVLLCCRCHQGPSLPATSTSCISLKPNLSSCSRHLHFLPCVFSVLVSTSLPLLSSCSTDQSLPVVHTKRSRLEYKYSQVKHSSLSLCLVFTLKRHLKPFLHFSFVILP